MEPMELNNHVVAAERTVIGGMLMTNAKHDVDLSPSDFYDPKAEAAWQAILAMQAQGDPVDPGTVYEHIESTGGRLPGLTFDWLFECVQMNTAMGHVESHVGIVRDAAVRRRVEVAARGVLQAAQDGRSADDLTDYARGAFDAVGPSQAVELESLAESMPRTIEMINQPPNYVLSPWADLNARIGGFSPGRLYVIGARPGVGKSVAALQSALALTGKGYVSFCSLEMSKEELNQRIIAHDLLIPMGRIVNNQLDERDWGRISERMQTWARSRLMVNDESGVTFNALRRHARAVAKRGELSGVIVDYLQLLSAEPGDQRKRHEIVADFSRNLKILARELQVPVIALSQLNRESAAREDKRPKISDLRESGAVEQDADVVILLHRELGGERVGDLSMFVAKNRQGGTGDVQLEFRGEFSRADSPGSFPGRPQGAL